MVKHTPSGAEIKVRIWVLLLCVILILSYTIVVRSEQKTVNTEFPGVQCTLTEITRDESILTAHFVLTAQQSSRISGACYPDGRCDPYTLSKAFLLAGRRRYEVATDSKGNPLASKIECPYGQYNIGPKTPIDIYVSFVAPPRKTRIVAVYLPDVDPFRDVPISETSSTVIYLLYCAMVVMAFILGMFFQSIVARGVPPSIDGVVTLLRNHRGKSFSMGLSFLTGLFSFLYAKSIISLWGFSIFIRILVTCILLLVIYIAYKKHVIQLGSALLAIVGILTAIAWSFTVYP